MFHHRHIKAQAGQTAYHAGLAAESSVEIGYLRRGFRLCARRWRGASGEIDLIFEKDGGFIFVEVKTSASIDRAARRITPRQTARIFAAATEFVATQAKGLLSDMRFDVALVAHSGEIRILENALQTA